MNEQKVSCGTRIKEALKLRGMKQADLVRLTGIGKSGIRQYISGKFVPRQNATHAIAKALNVSEAWLMGFDVPIQRSEAIKTVITEEEQNFLKLFDRLDRADKEQLKNYIKHVLLVAPKYAQRENQEKGKVLPLKKDS